MPTTASRREVLIDAIAQANGRGARLARACAIAGISVRTLQRWRAHPGGDDRRCGPHRRPRNALSSREEGQILSVLKSARYAFLSPKQLVPQLAHEGLYLASVSTLQPRHGLKARKRSVNRTDVTRAATLHRASKPNLEKSERDGSDNMPPRLVIDGKRETGEEYVSNFNISDMGADNEVLAL